MIADTRQYPHLTHEPGPRSSGERLVEQRASPLSPEPGTGEWVFGLGASASTNGEDERGVGTNARP